MEDCIKSLHSGTQVEEVLKGLLEHLTFDTKNRDAMKRIVVSSGLVKAILSVLRQNWCYQGSPGSPGNFDRAVLTSASSESANIKDPLVAVMALNCLYHISDSPSSLINKFVDKEFVQLLMSYIIPNPTLAREDEQVQNRFFQFGPSYTASVRKQMSSCEGLVKVLVEEEEEEELCSEGSEEKSSAQEMKATTPNPQDVLKAELKFYEPGCHDMLDKSAEIKTCQVKVPSNSKDTSLADQLVSEGVAWPLGREMITALDRNKRERLRRKKERTGQENNECCHAKITHALRGNFFWVILGEEKIQKAKQVTSLLQSLKPDMTNIVPKKLDALAAEVQLESCRKLVRARLLSVSGAVFTVQDVDTGCVSKVSKSDMYCLPPSLNLVKIPPLATLASLKGVLPVPLDARAPELAAGALSLVVRKGRVSTVYHLTQNGLLPALPGLIICPDPEVTYRVLDLVARILNYRTQAVYQTPWYCLIPGTLATLRKCIQQTVERRAASKENSSIPSQENLTYGPLQSDCTDDAEVRSSEAAEVTSRPGSPTCGEGARIHILVETCLACLANYMFKSCQAKSWFYQHRGLESVIKTYLLFFNSRQIRMCCVDVLTNYVCNYASPEPLQGGKKSGSANGTSPNGAGDALQVVSSKSADSSNVDDSSESEEEDSSDVMPESSSSSTQHTESRSLTSEGSSQGENQSTGPRKFYTRGEKAPFVQDVMHELQKTCDVKLEELTAVICGMLNTGRPCTIYMGIDPEDSVVHGIEKSRCDRDELRMGIDELMVEKISPCVLHLQFEVVYIPVLDVPEKWDNHGEESALSHDGTLHVLELHIKPLPDVIYCCSTKDCYYRIGGKTVMLDSKLLYHLLILEEEARSIEHIVELQKELEKLGIELSELEETD